MRKSLLLLTLSLLAITFNSCSKSDNDGDEQETQGKWIKTMTHDNGNIATFTYDSQNRLATTSWSDQDPRDSYSVVYEYKDNLIITKCEKYDYTETFTFDDGDYLTKLKSTSLSGEEDYEYIENYTYSNGYLSKKTLTDYYDGYSNTTTIQYTWSDGNLMAINISDGTKAEFQYNDVLNKQNIDYFPSVVGEEYMERFKSKGNHSKHLPISMKVTGAGYFDGLFTLEYTYDTEGYVTGISVKRDSVLDNSIAITYY